MKKEAIVLASALSVMGGTAGAADVYSLDPVVITAERRMNTDLRTPSAIEVFTAKDLEQTGATGMNEALKFGTGLLIQGQGPKNLTQGSAHQNKVVVRGVEKGTLVLVDGVPMNQNGKYFLNRIPLDSVEKVEVIRGGGAVLYGSEAAGGVVNIITKGTRANMVKAALGNYGMQSYAVSLQSGDLGLTYNHDKSGHIDRLSAPSIAGTHGFQGNYFNSLGSESHHVNWRYNVNDKLYISHDYDKSDSQYRYIYNGVEYAPNAGKTYKDYVYSSNDHMARLQYMEGDLKAGVFYHRGNMSDDAYTAYPAKPSFNPNNRKYTYSKYLEQTLGVDVSNRWHFGKGSFFLGTEFRRDMETIEEVKYNKGKFSKGTGNYSRNMYSLYGQVEYGFNSSTRGDFNFRQTWTEADVKGNKFHRFTPEFILIHDIDDNEMIYGKVGKSFMMPTFKQLYGGGIVEAAPGLKPQTGTHYELGWKKNIGDEASIRVALYRYENSDSLEAKDKLISDVRTIRYTNENIKNTGIEAEWKKVNGEHFSYLFGMTLQHPEKQATNSSTYALEGWHDYLGKYQFNVGAEYKKEKWMASTSMMLLAGRVRDGGNYDSYKSQFFTNLHVAYTPNKQGKVFLHLDNIFDRQDIISRGTSNFYTLGRNFMLGYEYKW